MLMQLCKQAWFVLLMVFAIGWSGVSMASVKTMQMGMQMQHQQDSQQNLQIQSNNHQNEPLSDAQMMQGMSVQEMKNHCMDLQQQAISDAAHSDNQSHDQQMKNLKACHAQLIQSKQLQHNDCQECTLFSCQSSLVWFNADIPQLSPPEHLQNRSVISIAYQAQHLAGHWQEILRPPKA